MEQPGHAQGVRLNAAEDTLPSAADRLHMRDNQVAHNGVAAGALGTHIADDGEVHQRGEAARAFVAGVAVDRSDVGVAESKVSR